MVLSNKRLRPIFQLPFIELELRSPALHTMVHRSSMIKSPSANLSTKVVERSRRIRRLTVLPSHEMFRNSILRRSVSQEGHCRGILLEIAVEEGECVARYPVIRISSVLTIIVICLI